MALTPEQRRAAALAEVEAARAAALPLMTLELTHPVLPGPVRVVADAQDLTAKLETGATATFQALAFQLTPPSNEQSRWPEVEIRLDGAADVIEPHLAAVMGSDQPIAVTWREYLRELALDGPSRVLSGLEIDETSAGDLAITARAGLHGFDKKFGKSYDVDIYPCLV